MRRSIGASLDVDNEVFGEGGTNIPPSGNDLVDRTYQLLARAVLGYITRGAGLESATRILFLGVHAKD